MSRALRSFTAPFVLLSTVTFLVAALPALADTAATPTMTLAPVTVTDWKAVYGRIEARDRLPARARLGGTLVELTVAEGDLVTAGQALARVVDAKIGFQKSALEAQREAISAQLVNAEAELKRGQDLLKQGVTTAQRLDALRTQVDVLNGQMASVSAQINAVTQQEAEGVILAPMAGRVLDVPLAAGAVVMPGEEVALLSGGGTFLRLAVPERHATRLIEGDTLRIDGPAGPQEGRIARVYPLIENGRVVADVEVPGLPDRFVDARVLVNLPIAERQALMVPLTALRSQAGLDFVAVAGPDGPLMRVIVPGQVQDVDGTAMVEVLTGLVAGDTVLTIAPLVEGASHD